MNDLASKPIEISNRKQAVAFGFRHFVLLTIDHDYELKVVAAELVRLMIEAIGHEATELYFSCLMARAEAGPSSDQSNR